MANLHHNSKHSSTQPTRHRFATKPAGLKFLRTGLGLLVLALAGFAGSQDVQGAPAEYLPLEIAADVKSRFSDGCSSIQELMTQAETRGLDGLIFGDHDRKSIQYGVPYLENVLRIKMDSPSLLSNGAATFLSELNQIDKSDDTVVLVPGVESAPFYYWTGNPLDDDLVAHNWDKHLLIIGLPSSLNYDEIPTLNSSFTTRYLKGDIVLFTIYCVASLMGLYGFMGKRGRGFFFVFTVVMSLFAANHHPFKSSPFDPYRGDLGAEPYQHLIDYANSKGALVFWNHLETPVTEDIDNGLFPVKTQTDRHPKDLLRTHGYTGFQALSETPVTAVEPGHEWDQALNLYLIGARENPVWGYGANDFHCEEKNQNKLGAVVTVVLAKQKNRSSVVEALRAGHMYAVKHQQGSHRLSLDSFALVDSAAGKRAVMGETLKTKNPPDIGIRLSMTGETAARAKVRLVRNGKVVKQGLLDLPYEGVWQDSTLNPAKPAYYRLLVSVEDQHQLVSNPIFVDPGPRPPTEVASVPEDPTANTVPQPLAADATPSAPAEAVPAPEIPTVMKSDTPPAEKEKQVVPAAKPPAESQQYVEVTGNGVRLREGPSTKFPVAGKAAKGERLLLVQRTEMMYKGKAWLRVQKDGRPAYVWEGLVKTP